MVVRPSRHGAAMKYRVYTFRHDRENRKPQYSAYTMWANPSWPGCKVLEVEAENSKEAKKLAIALRKESDTTAREGVEP